MSKKRKKKNKPVAEETQGFVPEPKNMPPKTVKTLPTLTFYSCTIYPKKTGVGM